MFASLKLVYRERVEQLEREDVNTIDKKHFISLYSFTREIALTSKNIKIDFVANKLMSFNLNKVLRDISKSFAKLIISKVDKMKIEPYSQNEILQTFVTLVLAKTLISLQNLIIKQDAHAFDKTNK
jgi:hypothetical protein